MQLLLWVFVGLVVGWLAGRSLEGEGYGASMDISMGIAGALIGGILMKTSGFQGFSGMVMATIVAMTGAAILTTLAAIGNGKRVYSRAF